MEHYMDMFLQWLLKSGIQVIVILVGSFAVIRIMRIIIRKSKVKLGSAEKLGIERVKRTDTLAGIVENSVRAVILIAALLMALRAIGFDIGPLLAGAGVVGLAVGFGAQSLVKDIISGFFILMENHMNVGDVVRISGVAGLVESINLRVTTLRDLEGHVHVVPNGDISVVTNMTKEWSRALVTIGVAYKEDVDHVIDVLKEVGVDMTGDETFGPKIIESLDVLGLDNFGNSSVDIKVAFKTKPREQWNVAREFRRRVKKAFDDKGIEIPFPHVTLYMGEGENTGRLKVDVDKGAA